MIEPGFGLAASVRGQVLHLDLIALLANGLSWEMSGSSDLVCGDSAHLAQSVAGIVFHVEHCNGPPDPPRNALNPGSSIRRASSATSVAAVVEVARRRRVRARAWPIRAAFHVEHCSSKPARKAARWCTRGSAPQKLGFVAVRGGKAWMALI